MAQPLENVKKAMLQGRLEAAVGEYMRAAAGRDRASMAAVESRLAEWSRGEPVVAVLLQLASRRTAELCAMQDAYAKKSATLDSLLAQPRRIAKAVGLIHDESEGERITWAVIQGPPDQAVRIGANLSPEQICEDCPEHPVWVWLAESAQSVVVVGKITAPPLLQVGTQRAMVFEGLVETEEGESDVE